MSYKIESAAPHLGSAAMRLVGDGGDSFELNILGYQYPRIENDAFDSNWLNIRVSAKNAQGSWNATDPSLLTGEVVQLASWLEAVAYHAGSQPQLDFIEPNLAFEIIEASDRSQLRVWFELESRPDWAPADEVPARDLCVDLNASREELIAAVESLRAQLQRFPPRATV